MEILTNLITDRNKIYISIGKVARSRGKFL